VHASLKPDYPKRAEQFSVQFQLDQGEGLGKVSPRELIGYQLKSEDEKRLVRLTLHEFTFSQLAPYDRWETLRAEAKRVWDVYESTFHPRRILRVAVRYVNRVDIPNPQETGIDLDVYFRTGPKIAPELPQMLRTFFVRLELPFRDPNGVLIFTQANAQPPSPGVVSTLLDFDVIMQNVDFDVATAWRTVDELRDIKNSAFENCITDTARELFK
jgi:uncharacterized protein (TIGR04255 family)